MSDFPAPPQSNLTRDSIVDYLRSLKSQGYDIYQEQNQPSVFFVILGETHRLRIIIEDAGTGQVQLLYLNDNLAGVLDVSSFAEFETAVSQLARKVSADFPARPSTARLQASTPATNYSKISALLATAKIEAIFDPYLENKSLIEVDTILSFSDASVADGVRLLGGPKPINVSPPRLSKNGVEAWLKERGVSGEARVLPSKDEHRRFMLLSNGQSLITGHSFNAPHKNEAVRLEPDTEDRKFFEDLWAKSVPLS